MKIPHSRHFLSCLLGATLVWSIGPVRAGDLMDSYREARSTNPQLQQFAYNREAVSELKPQARALLLPQVAFNADTAWNETETNGTDSDFNSNSWTASLLQSVFNYEYWVQLRQADDQIAQAEAEYQTAEQLLQLLVSERYFDVLSALDDLDAANDQKKSVGRQLEQAQQRFEVGLIAITDVKEAEAEYASSEALVIRAQNAVDNAREALREITGVYDKDLAKLKEEIPLVQPEPTDEQKWVDTALQQSPQIIAAQYGSESAREEIERQRAGHYPTVDLFAQTGNVTTGSSSGMLGRVDTDADVIGVELNVPIYLGGSVVSRTREAQARFGEATSFLEETTRSVERDTRDSYLNIQSSISRVEALYKAVVATEASLEATEAGYEVGTRTIVDVLAAQRNLTQARVDYSRERYNYLVQTLSLKQAAGILHISDLESINGLLIR